MKKFFFYITILLFIINGSCGYCRQNEPKIVVTDFRNANKLETFYYWDRNKNDYIFVPVGFKNYIGLSKENKSIYKQVKKAQRLKTLSETIPFKTARLNLGQTAYKINPDLTPVAYNLCNEFKKNNMYSTALYYAQKVEQKDKKNRFTDIRAKTGELNYKLGNYDTAAKELKDYIKSPQAQDRQKAQAYAILADITIRTADAKKANSAYKQALVYADKALSLDENNILALESKYTSCLELKSYISARNTAQKLLNIDKENADYMNKLKVCEKVLKK